MGAGGQSNYMNIAIVYFLQEAAEVSLGPMHGTAHSHVLGVRLY